MLPQQTIIYYTDIAELGDMPGLDLLTPGRRSNTLRYRKHDDQVRSLAAGLLLRHCLSSAEPERGIYGKPFFPDKSQFCLSHSGSYVVLAISPDPTGVDVEKLRPWTAKVAERCFLPSELSWLAEQSDPAAAFFTLWTAKESVMKATGEGFHMPPHSVRVDPQQKAGWDAHGASWHLRWYSLPDHVVCLATEAADTCPPLIRLTREELLG